MSEPFRQLAVILDCNPSSWSALSTSSQVPNHRLFETVVDQLVVFLNATRLVNRDICIHMIAMRADFNSVIAVSPLVLSHNNTNTTTNNDTDIGDSIGRSTQTSPFPSTKEQLLAALLAKSRAEIGDGQSASLVAGALTQAMCMLSKGKTAGTALMRSFTPTRAAPIEPRDEAAYTKGGADDTQFNNANDSRTSLSSSDTKVDRVDEASRLLIISASRDDPLQHVAAMNAIFFASSKVHLPPIRASLFQLNFL